MKYTTTLDSRQSTTARTTTNQKQAATIEGSTEGTRCDKRDAWGKRDTIILGGRCKLNNWYKLLKSLSLVTIFFSAGLYYSKTQPHRPRSTPSPEATGVGRLEMQKAMPLDRRPTPPWRCSLLDGLTLVNHLFVLFLCSKCYGMLDKREFCFVLVCVVNFICSITRSSTTAKS